MIPVARLGFAIRRLYSSLLGLVIDPAIPSQEVAEQFQAILAEEGLDVAMCWRTDLLALLAYAATTSPDTTMQDTIGRLTADIEVPPVSAV